MARAGRMGNDNGRMATVRVPLDSIDGDPVEEGEIQSRAEVDADQVTRENNDDVLGALTALDMGNEVTWQIYRLFPAADQGYICDLATAELTMRAIAERGGPGKYRIRGTYPNGTYAGQRTVWVAKPTAPLSGPGTSLVPVNTTGAQVNDYLQFLERSKLAQKEELKFWVGLLMPILGPLMLKLFDKRESGIGEMVTALKAMKGMTDGESSIDQLQKTRQLVELVKDLSPDKEATGSTWPDLVRDGLQAAAPVIQGLIAAKAANAGNAAASAGPQRPQPQQEQTPMMQLLGWLKAQIPMLVQRAQRNADPGLYAEVLIDNLPPGIEPSQLVGFLQRPDWWTLLVQFAPPVQPYEGWFSALRDALGEFAARDEEPEPEHGQNQGAST